MSNRIVLAEAKPGQSIQSGFQAWRIVVFCKAPLRQTFVDLGMSPLCESYVTAEQLNRMEPFYPRHVKVCEQCHLVLLEEYVSPEHKVL
jgi:hypothetical protein